MIRAGEDGDLLFDSSTAGWSDKDTVIFYMLAGQVNAETSADLWYVPSYKIN